MYYVYVMNCLRDKSIYVGYTDDLDKRLAEHNSGKNISTRSKKLWEVVYSEVFKSKLDALDREKKLKNHGKGVQEFKKRIINSLS